MPLIESGTYSGTARKVGQTFWFDRKQSSLSITNNDSVNKIVVTVADAERTLYAGESFVFSEEFDSFTIKTKKGDASFTVVSSGSVTALSAANANLETNLANKQDWYEVYKRLKVANDNRLLVKKIDADNINVYVNHHDNTYQQWRLTRDSGLDAAVTSHANGDPWQAYTVTNVRLGDTTSVGYAAMTQSGTWNAYDPTLKSTTLDSYVEAVVTGSSILLYGNWKADGGQANLKIDTVDYGTIDFYDPSAGGVYQTKEIASGLSAGAHTVRLTVLHTKQAAATDYAVRPGILYGVNPVDWADFTDLADTVETLPTRQNFRGNGAIEIAIENTVGANKVWSGTYHKNLYPVAADNQKIYLDGKLITLDSLTANTFYACKDFQVTQNLKMCNGATDIADVVLLEHFTAEGYHVKWNLTWLYAAIITTSYSIMMGAYINKLVFGDDQTVNTAVRDDKSVGSWQTYNAMGWQTQDNYLVAVKALNEKAMEFTGPLTRYMYYRDRVTDMKIYLPRYVGTVAIGDKWVNEFIVSVGKVSDAASIMI